MPAPNVRITSRGPPSQECFVRHLMVRGVGRSVIGGRLRCNSFAEDLAKIGRHCKVLQNYLRPVSRSFLHSFSP